MTADALILAGGQSRRMGQDKALLRLTPQGPRLIEMTLAVVRPLVENVLINTNQPQLYADLGYPIVTDDPAYRGMGPLAGLEAGLNAATSRYSLALACDMPYVQPALLNYLLSLAGPDSWAVVPYSSANQAEPLCAVYSRECLPVIRQHLAAGSLRLSNWLAEVPVRRVDPAEWNRYDPAGLSFRNLNTPQDLAEANKGALYKEQE